jgi:hypothetical protein
MGKPPYAKGFYIQLLNERYVCHDRGLTRDGRLGAGMDKWIDEGSNGGNLGIGPGTDWHTGSQQSSTPALVSRLLIVCFSLEIEIEVW